MKVVYLASAIAGIILCPSELINIALAAKRVVRYVDLKRMFVKLMLLPSLLKISEELVSLYKKGVIHLLFCITACFASLRSILIVELIGLEKLTNGFGLLLLFQGVAAAIGSPIAGIHK